MAELDERMHDIAAKALARNGSDWQAYLLLDTAERRIERERDIYGDVKPESAGVSDFAMTAREYIQTGDEGKLHDCLGTARAMISELRAASEGDCRRNIDEWLRGLSSML